MPSESQNITSPQQQTDAAFILSGARQICCSFHPASGEQRRKRSCLLAQPIGHDYILNHRAHRQLALRLARRGVDVLRFDFTGCGDSEGDLLKTNLAEWTEDLLASAAELQRRTPNQDIGIMATGLAASLALDSKPNVAPWSFMALWQPFLVGQRWIDHLEQQQVEVATGNAATFKESSQGAIESVGFEYGKSLVADVQPRKFCHNELPQTERLLLIDSKPEPSHQEFVNQVISRGLLSSYVSLPPESSIDDDPFKPRVPHDVIQAAVDWIVE